jgi:hypothetical protein
MLNLISSTSLYWLIIYLGYFTKYNLLTEVRWLLGKNAFTCPTGDFIDRLGLGKAPISPPGSIFAPFPMELGARFIGVVGYMGLAGSGLGGGSGGSSSLSISACLSWSCVCNSWILFASSSYSCNQNNTN